MKNKVLIIFKYPREHWNRPVINKFSNFYDIEYLYISDYKNKNFTEVINEINDLKRIRYTTSHPKDMTDDLIEVYKSSNKLMPMVHLPVQSGSNKILKLLAKRKDPSTALIGVGGIFSASDVYEKIRLGASAVQIYSGFVYNGPMHIKKMERELEDLLLKDGYGSIERAVGASIR